MEELRQPLDPGRVRSRKGRGKGQFEYLAGHDVKRRANELFGFGSWGHHVLLLDEIAAVPVTSDGKEGVHVGYRCIVEVWVNVADDYRTFTTHGVGYGDGVEYGQAARVTACELAVKEAETDAMKRAFTDLGDQFGLILYAKDDEKRRIESDRAASAPAAPARPAAPTGWKALGDRWAYLFGDPSDPYALATAQTWMREAAGGSIASLDGDEKKRVAVVMTETLLDLEASGVDLALGTGVRHAVQVAFAKYLDGRMLEGPPWRLDPVEADRPPFAMPEPAGGPTTPSEPEPDPVAEGAGREA